MFLDTKLLSFISIHQGYKQLSTCFEGILKPEMTMEALSRFCIDLIIHFVLCICQYNIIRCSGTSLCFVDNYDEDNNNNEEDSVHEFARIFGTEHPWFWRVHITALCALSE